MKSFQQKNYISNGQQFRNRICSQRILNSSSVWLEWKMESRNYELRLEKQAKS